MTWAKLKPDLISVVQKLMDREGDHKGCWKGVCVEVGRGAGVCKVGWEGVLECP